MELTERPRSFEEIVSEYQGAFDKGMGIALLKTPPEEQPAMEEKIRGLVAQAEKLGSFTLRDAALVFASWGDLPECAIALRMDERGDRSFDPRERMLTAIILSEAFRVAGLKEGAKLGTLGTAGKLEEYESASQRAIVYGAQAYRLRAFSAMMFAKHVPIEPGI